MNRYGKMARDHWARWLPARYAQIHDPESFFTALGREAEQRIGDLAMDLAGNGTPGEDYPARVRRLNMARLQAEETVLAERVLLEPETRPQGTSEQDTGEAAAERPAVVDRGHPLWGQVNAEQQERLQGG